jgi:hypothetical protein
MFQDLRRSAPPAHRDLQEIRLERNAPMRLDGGLRGVTPRQGDEVMMQRVTNAALAAAIGAGLFFAFGTSRAQETSELGTWEDRVMIDETLQRYARGFDANDPEVFASAFAQEGVFQYNDDVYTGRAEIAGFIEGRLNGRAPGINRESRLYHVMTNSVVTFSDPDHAHHSAYGMTIGRTVGETHISSSGSYEDELVKIDGAWFIQTRMLDQLPVFNPNATAGPAADEDQ